MKVVGYIRSATDNLEALAVQRSKIDSYCVGRGWELVAVESDNGVSGLRTKRPGLHRLLKRIENPKIGCIVMSDRSRLSRRVSDALRWERKFAQFGIEVVYVAEREK